MDKKVFIIGSSGHAKVITEILEELNIELLGYIDSFAKKGTMVFGYKVLGDESILKNAAQEYNCTAVIVGIGENSGREKVVQRIKAINPAIEFPIIIAKSASVSKSSKLGEGSVILRNAIVNTGSTIGNHCIINTSAIVEHDCVLADFVNIASNAVLGGGVAIGKSSFIGLNTSILQKRIIGEKSVVAAGAVVTKNFSGNTLIAGCPAVVKKENYHNLNVLK